MRTVSATLDEMEYSSNTQRVPSTTNRKRAMSSITHTAISKVESKAPNTAKLLQWMLALGAGYKKHRGKCVHCQCGHDG